MNPELLRQQDFWNRTSQNFDAIYSHEKSRLANWADRVLRWDMYERFNYTMRQAEPIHDRTFLDVGCGTGRYALEFAHKGARGVIGLDVSDVMVTTCLERARSEQVADRVTFLHCDLLEYRPKTRFDVGIGIGLFDYIEDPLPVLKKMREHVLDRVIVSFPMTGTWRALVRRFRLKLLDCDVYFYSPQQVEALLHDAGFKRHEADQIGQLYCVTAYVE